MPTNSPRASDTADDRPRLRPVPDQPIEDRHVLERPTDQQPALLLTVAQAAQRLGVGRSLLYELMAAGELQSIHVRRLRRIPADEINAYIARQRHHSP